MNKTSLVGALALVVLGLGACDSTGIAYGDANSIIAVMAPALWNEMSEDVYRALEPTVRTVRDEKTFTVTYQEPHGDNWAELRRFRQMLLVGTSADRWVQEALDRAPDPISQTGLHQIDDVWAHGQQVTLVLLPDGGGADDLRQQLRAVNELLDGQFRTYVVNRMYMSGVDSALADTLYVEAGFILMLPQVYRWERSDSAYVFRNDNPDPSELIRQVGVTWKTPIPPDMQAEDILEWREQFVADHYSEPQDQVVEDAYAEPFEYRGRYAYQIRAQWQNPPDRGWPAGGPFLTRAVVCENQNRMYLVDSWLYAPTKEKYEYMIQLETILDSFRCGSA